MFSKSCSLELRLRGGLGGPGTWTWVPNVFKMRFKDAI